MSVVNKPQDDASRLAEASRCGLNLLVALAIEKECR
jgi:hypothetical protein